MTGSYIELNSSAFFLTYKLLKQHIIFKVMYFLLQEERGLDFIYSNRSLEFLRFHILYTPPIV